MAYACLLCQLNRSQEASIILKRLIHDGYEPVKVNMLLSIAYQMDGDSFMADKYKAISNLMQLRSLNRVPDSGTSKTNLVPKSSELATANIKVLTTNASQPGMEPSQNADEPTNEVESAKAFQNIRLTDVEQDEVLISLAQYLIGENMSEFAESCISRVEDKQNFNYLGCVAKISIQVGNVSAAIPALEQMLELKNTWLEGYIEIGHAHYKQGDNERALASYLKAIRIANLTQQEIKDQLVFQRAGHVYIQLKKWEDAKVMFLMCAEDYKTAFSHFNLGVACYNLGEYDEAERVLSLVNYLDPTNAETWAYLALVLLKKDEPPLHAAYQTMNESLKLGLTKCAVMLEITLSWLDLGCDKQAFEALDSTIKIKLAKATSSNNAEKARFFKQWSTKLKGMSHEDTELVKQVIQQIKDK